MSLRTCPADSLLFRPPTMASCKQFTTAYSLWKPMRHRQRPQRAVLETIIQVPMKSQASWFRNRVHCASLAVGARSSLTKTPQQHLQSHLQCGNHPGVAKRSGIPSAARTQETGATLVLKNTTFRASAISQNRSLYETSFQNAC